MTNPATPQPHILYEYCILRYVPDIERGEFLNVGLLMMCKRRRWLRCELIADYQRIEQTFPDADITRLKRQLQPFTATDVPSRDLPVEERYRWMAAVKSAIIQVSPSHPGIILPAAISENSEKSPDDLLNAEFTRLFRRLV